MPNIEIHGFGLRGPFAQEAIALRKRIFEILEASPVARDIVVSIYDDIVVDKKGEAQPYLRIVFAPADRIFLDILSLKVLGFDIEVLELKNFQSRNSQSLVSEADLDPEFLRG